MAYDLTLDGIVVSELALNDNDKLLTLITSKRGKMVVLAKGIKSIKSKRSAGAQLFCYSTFGFVKRDERLFLDSIEIKDAFSGLSEDIESVALASYFCEVAAGICMEDNDESEMLRLLLNSIYALSYLKNKPHWMVKAAFELKSMCIQGFCPNFDTCAMCSGSLNFSKKQIIFELLQGGFLCNRCICDDSFELSKDGYAISGATFSAIRHICSCQQARMLSFTFDNAYIKEFSQICEKYLIVHTEKRYKSLDYYHKNF